MVQMDTARLIAVKTACQFPAPEENLKVKDHVTHIHQPWLTNYSSPLKVRGETIAMLQSREGQRKEKFHKWTSRSTGASSEWKIRED